MTIAEQLKAGRTNAGLSQEEVAEKVGISRRTVAYYENGERTPNADILLKLCEVYSIRIDSLITSGMGEEKGKEDDLKASIDEYLRFQRSREQAFKKGIFIALACVSAIILFVLLLACILRFYLAAVYGYEFSQATAALWTGFFNVLIEFVNNETTQNVPVFSILIASCILLGWGIYFLIRLIKKRK